MAIEMPIGEEAQWFAEEDKPLRYTVRNDLGAIEPLDGWTLTWELRTPREAGVAPLLVLEPTVLDAPGGLVSVTIPAESVPAGEYIHALWRTDLGQRALLSYGPVIIRTIEEV